MAETIAAISTAPGEGGIGIVRVSGPESMTVMKNVMNSCPAEVKPRHAYLGKVNKNSGEIIDEAIFLFMKGPASYTGEDMLEIQAHGSNVSLKEILRRVLDCGIDSIRMAEPGEFTKLAFLNGKMDLSQAEAVIDIIKAKSDISLEIAEGQKEGRLGNSIREIRSEILGILAEMAVNIDYPDEDIEDVTYDDMVNRLSGVKAKVTRLLDTSSIGRIAREGVKVAIIGKPNVGKSSLMNTLLGEGRVIVTDIPGTTRDTVEETASIEGLPIVLIDTAGLRETEDVVEKIGIERTQSVISSADLVILVIDGSSELEAEDRKIIEDIVGTEGSNFEGSNIIVVLNKKDLGQVVDKSTVEKMIPGCRIVETSLVGTSSLDAASLVSRVISDRFALGMVRGQESNIVSNERHIKLLKNSRDNIDEACGMLRNGEPLEVSELSVRYAYDELGAIVGEEVGEDVIDAVFTRFCLGK